MIGGQLLQDLNETAHHPAVAPAPKNGLAVAFFFALALGIPEVGGIAGEKVLANEWAGRGVNVNGIAPGYIATDNTEALRQDADRSASILSRIPAGRWGDPADFKGPVVFLASPAGAYVHGTILTVDGGWMGR
jgi:hypothetical protein